MLFGLAIGLSVAFAIYMKDRRPTPVTTAVAPAPASMAESLAAEQPPAQQEPGEKAESRFSFYDMLPKFEVIIPEQEPDVSREQSVAAGQVALLLEDLGQLHRALKTLALPVRAASLPKELAGGARQVPGHHLLQVVEAGRGGDAGPL